MSIGSEHEHPHEHPPDDGPSVVVPATSNPKPSDVPSDVRSSIANMHFFGCLCGCNPLPAGTLENAKRLSEKNKALEDRRKAQQRGSEHCAVAK